ncbi:MAG: EexN family lipoprotein [Deltaproteobacteria bacterium]|nr:EexN family lipoprotein [Deltaproteobacteria bacterium]
MFLVVLASCVFAGCKEPEPKTVSWWMEHPVERKAMVAKCRDNPGQGRHNPDCINAERANYAAAQTTLAPR